MDYASLLETVYKRRSVRKYKDVALSLDRLSAIRSAIGELVPLYPEIGVVIDI